MVTLWIVLTLLVGNVREVQIFETQQACERFLAFQTHEGGVVARSQCIEVRLERRIP